MPIYEYNCEDCGTRFEKLVRRSSDAAEIECPSCGQKHLPQELSTFAAHANGAPEGGNAVVPKRPVQQSGHVRDELGALGLGNGSRCA